MAVVKLNKVVETIAFSDDPRAHVYTIKTDDRSLENARQRILAANKLLEDAEDDSSKAVRIMRDTVAAFVVDGDRLFDEAVEYVTDGDRSLKAEDVLWQLFPLYDYVCDRIIETFNAVSGARVAKYLAPNATSDGQEGPFKVL